jgi:hypothetical protein
LDSDKGTRRPLVVLAFDEADTLTDNPREQNWNLFTELHRILRQIHHYQIFSLFISTAGRFNKFSPDVHPLCPISEISFDDLALPALKDTVMMQKVVEIDWMVHLGRPLYVRPVSFRELLLYHLK